MAFVSVIASNEHDRSDLTAKLRTELERELRPVDTAWLLPGASASLESSDLKNTVLGLDPSAPGPPVHLFGSDWGHGVSAIRVPTERVESLVATPEQRVRLLQAMRDAIPCELIDSNIQVGPQLQSNHHKDAEGDDWVVGFDGVNCSCGLYYATELRSSTGNRGDGMTRPVDSYFLVAKAGGGLAAQQFHAELSGLFADKTASLQQIDQAHQLEHKMQRVVQAGRRNRAAILHTLAKVMGMIADIDVVVDHASANSVTPKQLAILRIDAVTNVLIKSEREEGAREVEWKYFAGAVAPSCSQSSIMCSNALEGYIGFFPLNEQQDALHLRNEAGGALPFSSLRTSSGAQALERAVSAHCERRGHPEHEWIQQHFAWYRPAVRRVAHLDPKVQQCIDALEPAPLWGTHTPATYTRWLRPLGAEEANVVRLFPTMVVMAGNESSVLRSVATIADDQRRARAATVSATVSASFLSSSSVSCEPTTHASVATATPATPATLAPPPKRPSDDRSGINRFLTQQQDDDDVSLQFDDSFMRKFGLNVEE